MELLSEFILRKSLEIKEFDSLKADNTFYHLHSIVDIWYYIKVNFPNVKEPYIYYVGDSCFTLEYKNINIYIYQNGCFDYSYRKIFGGKNEFNCKLPCPELLVLFKQENRSLLQKIKDWVNRNGS